jgi:hypothetical protein
VLTGTGPVDISVPRDRDSSFESKIVTKRQRRLTAVDEMVISLSAKGLTHTEIAAHLAEVYGAEVSKQTITTVTGRVMGGMAEWQSRPLNLVYAVIFTGRGRDYRANAPAPGHGVRRRPQAVLLFVVHKSPRSRRSGSSRTEDIPASFQPGGPAFSGTSAGAPVASGRPRP